MIDRHHDASVDVPPQADAAFRVQRIRYPIPTPDTLTHPGAMLGFACGWVPRLHPEEALRMAQGILRLAQDFSPAQLAAACERAVVLKACNYRSVHALIVTPSTESGDARQLSLVHENVRGPVLPLSNGDLDVDRTDDPTAASTALRGMAGGLEQLLRSAQLQALSFEEPRND